MPRVLFSFLASTLGLLAAASPAPGKEAVRATIDVSRASLEAPAGTKIKVGWTLSGPPTWTDGARPSADARREPFGASGLYVRLDSRTGGAPTIAYGHGPTGRYSATATVPQGGIGGIELGLEGMRIVKGQAPQRADVFFPIDNDPFAAATGRGADPSPPWLWIGWAVIVGVALLVGVRRARLRRIA